MPHQSSDVSSATTAPLHPVLGAALNNLDVNLEEELGRYRRLRDRRPTPSKVERNRSQIPTVAKLNEVTSDPSVSIAPLYLEQESTADSATARTLAQLAIAGIPLAASEAALGSTPVEQEPYVLNEESPNDYLESSEELLRGLAAEEAELRRTEQEPALLQTLLTPLGIGSMMLLILSSVTFGYLLTNPSNLKFLGLEKIFKTPEPITEATVPSTLPDPTAPSSSVAPDLSSDEFVELNLGTLSTLPSEQSPVPSPAQPIAPTTTPTPAAVSTPQATLQTAPSPVRQTTAASPTPRRSTAVAPSPAARSERPRAAMARSTPTPAPIRATTPVAQPTPRTPPAPSVATAPSPAPAPVQQNLYYVTTQYSGDRSLAEARQVVGDAYVRNLPNAGAVVQLGAFSEASRAEELRQNLESQGIAAEIHQP